MRPATEVTSTKITGRVPQARRLATNARILDAALEVFSELGFENTQLDQVAARAGCSRGAIYAQYASKEDVFLALIRHRIHTRFAAMFERVKGEPDTVKRLPILRDWIIQQTCDQVWGTLTLEFKLYAVRRPESKERLLKLYDDLFVGFAKELPDLLFGKGLGKAARRALDQRLAVLGGALGSIVLESQMRPALFPLKQIQRLAGELFDALVHL